MENFYYYPEVDNEKGAIFVISDDQLSQQMENLIGMEEVIK